MKRRRMDHRIISCMLTAALLCPGASVYAENIKRERIYAVTDISGNVQSLTDSIRLENKDGLDRIEDRSMLQNIEITEGDASFSQDGDTLIWQADGNDISYQGSSDRTLPVLPVVRVTADGRELSGDELKDLNGRICLEVRYEAPEDRMLFAATIIPIPKDGVSELELTDAFLLDEGGMQCAAGWGVSGLDEEENQLDAEGQSTETDQTEAEGQSTETDQTEAEGQSTETDRTEAEGHIPDSFTISFMADHAKLSWMYTVCSAEPFHSLKDLAADSSDADISSEISAAKDILFALSEGSELPECAGKSGEAAEKIGQLNQGLTDLDDGAVKLSDGAGQLAEGADKAWSGSQELSTGLSALCENNQTLTDAMSAMLDAVLTVANEQIASSGLSDAGITVPELTRDNYQEVLESLLNQFSTEGVQQQVSEQVRSQVEENRGQIEEAVDEQVKVQVLEAILAEMDMEMTADEYNAAVDSGEITPLVSGGVQLALNAELVSNEVKEKRDAAVEEQISRLVEEHTKEYLDSEEGKEKLASASQAYDSLSSLKEQLTQAGQLKDGIDQYTDGVQAACDGAAQLTEGLSGLKSGADELSSGAKTLSDGVSGLHGSLTDAEKNAADTLLPYLESDMAEFLLRAAESAGNRENCAYDLLPEEMETDVVYIIRTDF